MLESHILQTPLIPFRRHFENRIILKAENLQPFGSYKIRGVASAISKMNSVELERGLCAASAGNMAQSVAFAAREVGVPCKIYVPNTAPAVKRDAIRNLGAEVIELPFQDVWEKVRSFENKESSFIHPVFTLGLTSGYGKIVDEILEEAPDTDAIVAPFGVGGLTLGVAERIHELHPYIHVYACEPETAAPLHVSLLAGKPVGIERQPSFVDAIGTPEVLPQVFTRVRPLIQDSIIVPLDEIRAAMRILHQDHKLVTEGAAAAGLAASLRIAKTSGYRKIATILTGGNIANETLREILS